jgi:hypothetical protein
VARQRPTSRSEPAAARPAPAARGLAASATAFLGGVLFPFALTRAALLVVAWFSTQLAPSWTYADPVGSTRGWLHVPELVLDVWGRYDTWWYLGLATDGYRPVPDLVHDQSNLAFFPLYPALVRWLHALLPAARRGDPARYTIAVLVANACAVAGAWVVHELVRRRWRDERLARRVVLYLLLFPTGFFLSCAYSESLFLLLSAGAFLAAQGGRWWIAGACAALAALTRSTGILVTPALVVLYASQPPDPGRRFRWDALALLIAPAALLAHALHLASISGDPMAMLHAQSAWGRAPTAPWETLARTPHPVMGPLELCGVALFVALAIALLVQREYALGAFAGLSLCPVLLSGTLMSSTRFLAVVFPAFIPLARLGANEHADRVVVVVFGFLQAVLFVAWSRFYWVA